MRVQKRFLLYVEAMQQVRDQDPAKRARDKVGQHRERDHPADAHPNQEWPTESGPADYALFVGLTAGLAGRFAAQLIGISALAIPPPVVAGGVVLAGTNEVDIKLMEATLADKGNWFRSLTGSDSRKPEWRSALDFPVEVLAREARSADLVVIGQRRGQWGAYRSLDPGEAILKMGRPTLVVPEGVGLVLPPTSRRGIAGSVRRP